MVVLSCAAYMQHRKGSVGAERFEVRWEEVVENTCRRPDDAAALCVGSHARQACFPDGVCHCAR